jgi:hypothetical protein
MTLSLAARTWFLGEYMDLSGIEKEENGGVVQ